MSEITYTPHQLAVLRIIAKYQDEKGYCPTAKEMAAELECKQSAIYALIETLIDKGAIKKGRGWRALTIIDEDASDPRSKADLRVELERVKEERDYLLSRVTELSKRAKK